MRIIPSRKANLKKKKRTNKNYIVKKSPLEEEKMRIISLRKAHLTNREIRIILGKHQYENYAVKKSPFEEEEMRIIPSRKAHLANKNMKIMEEKPTSQRRNKKITLWRIIEQQFFAIFLGEYYETLWKNCLCQVHQCQIWWPFVLVKIHVESAGCKSFLIKN